MKDTQPNILTNILKIKNKEKIILLNPTTTTTTNHHFQQNNDLNHNLIYQTFYNQDYLKSLFAEEISPTEVLRKQQVSEQLRAKMVNWMLEVFGNYDKTSSNFTYFRAVTIMDQFIRKAKRRLLDSDLHLIGVASIFLASKLEDVYHIVLDDIYSKVAHKRFSHQQIKEQEFEILCALCFRLTFPTAYKFMQYYCHLNFNNDDKISEKVKAMSTYILRMCNYEVKMMNVKTHILAMTVIVYSVKTVFLELMETGNLKELQKQEEIILYNLINNNGKFSVTDINEIIQKIKKMINGFENQFGGMKNFNTFPLN